MLEEVLQSISKTSPTMTTNDPTVLIGMMIKHKDIIRQVYEAQSKDTIEFSGRGILEARNVITSLDLPVQYAVISTDVFQKIIHETWFAEMCSPVTTAEVHTGKLCSLFGMDILCEAFFHPEERSFDRSAKRLFAAVSVTERHGTKIYRARFEDEDDQ